MYQINGAFRIEWVGDGCGPMSVPSSQVLKVSTFTSPVPGGDAPSTANISTACTTLSTALAALLNANIGQIQGFASGGG